MMKKLIKGIKKPELIFLRILETKISRVIPDVTFLKIKYKLMMNRNLNLDNPQTFNEKLQWLKIHDRNTSYKNLVDKYEVRKYISNLIGEEYLIPLLGVWNEFDEIDFKQLPDRFVLKPNHTSGNVFICKDKSRIDMYSLKKEISKWMKREYYWSHREWCYKNISPKIICEKYMVDESGVELKDYKIMCFNGQPKIIQVMSNRSSTSYHLNHYDLNWNAIKIKRKKYTENPISINKPNELKEMIRISKILSQDLPFCRVDLYSVHNKIFFGEITFFPVSGYMDFENSNMDILLGSWIKLPTHY